MRDRVRRRSLFALLTEQWHLFHHFLIGQYWLIVRRWLVHFVRWGLLAVIALTIHIRHARLTARPEDAPPITASLAEIQRHLPNVAALGPIDQEHDGRSLLDSKGNTIGFVVETAPAADDIIGYSGPNNVLLVFANDGRLAGATLLTSGDTDDHVAKVRESSRYWESLEGKIWRELAALKDVDAVSGATLTSVAIVEGIITRLEGTAPNLRFPEPPTLEEIKSLFPDAARLVAGNNTREWIVQDQAGAILGFVLRSSPLTDDRFGYQGPTDGLLALDATGETVVGIGINKSYDNTRYVEDVGLSWSFMHRFNGMQLEEFTTLTVGIGEDVEGVSGATRTSQTLIRNLVDVAKQRLAASQSTVKQTKSSSWQQRINWPSFRWQDYGIVVILVGAAVMAFTNVRGKTWIRCGWQAILIIYLGFMSGAFVSQALLVGWSRNGAPWQIAPGLVLLTAAALVVPLATKKNIYCHQLCPHGAAQVLLKRRLPWQIKLPSRLEQCLRTVPAALLIFVFIAAMVPLPVNLASVEAFDAWLWPAAGWVTVAIAVAGLVASLFVPMAYCRYGCPTGALLGYLRRNARDDKLTRRDALAVVLAIAGIVAVTI